LNSQIAAIDKYVGPPNIEVIGHPVDGRSGGGLFAADTGHLIGVCNMADPADDEGIYAALATIHWELDRIGLRQIYQSRADVLAGDRRQTAEPAREAAPPAMPTSMPATVPVQAPSAASVAGADLVTTAPGTPEIICIIRQDGQQQLLVLERPSPDLLQLLSQESRSAGRPTELALQPRQGSPSPAAWPRQRMTSEPAGSSQEYRAQSADR
jgi:hypothetical protein